MVQAHVEQSVSDGRGQPRQTGRSGHRVDHTDVAQAEGRPDPRRELIVHGRWGDDLDAHDPLSSRLGQESAHGGSADTQTLGDLGLRRVLDVVQLRRQDQQVLGKARRRRSLRG